MQELFVPALHSTPDSDSVGGLSFETNVALRLASLFILEKQKSIGNVKSTGFDIMEFEGEEDSNKGVLKRKWDFMGISSLDQ